MTDPRPRRRHGTDLALATAAGRGDRDARTRLAERLFDRVVSTVRYLFPGHRDADDLVQRALMEILRAAGSFRGESRLESWADRVTVRVTMREVKKLRTRGGRVRLTEEPDRHPDDADLPAETLSVRRRLAAELSRLPEERRTAVVLRFVHGYSIKEIAKLTDSNVNTVRDRLQVGKRELRKALTAGRRRTQLEVES